MAACRAGLKESWNACRSPIRWPSASVLALMEDREGNIWVGTETGGLHILRDQRFKTSARATGCRPTTPPTVVEDHSGALWVGTSGGGLERAADRRGRRDCHCGYIRAQRPAQRCDPLAGRRSQRRHLGGNSGRAEPHSRRRRSIPLPRPTACPTTSFARCWWMPTDRLWIATRRGSDALDPAARRCESSMRMETFTQANGLGSDLVGAMARDTSGDLWVATFAGLSRLHQGKITNFTTADGLSSNVITALLPRAKGTLLIGTQDHGWNLWDGQQFLARDPGPAREHLDSRHSRRRARPSLVRHRQWHRALRLCGNRRRDGRRGLPELDRVHDRRRPASAAKPPPTAIRPHGSRRMGGCGLPRPRDWSRWIRRISG